MRYLFLLLLLLPLCAHAQGDIHRCVGADGNPVFTDRICSDINAMPVTPAIASSTVTAPSLLAPPPVLCAGDLSQLKQAVIDAFAARDANRIGGLMLWDGAGKADVVATIRLITRLMQHPLLDVQTAAPPHPNPAPDEELDVDDPDVDDSPAPAAGRMLLVHTESEDGTGVPRETRFGVLHRSGCLWLRPLN